MYQYSVVVVVVVVVTRQFLFCVSSTYQHPEIVVNIVQVHWPQQTLECSHQDSSMLPGGHTHVYSHVVNAIENSFRSTESCLATPS